uniref:Uncharacterized protein n=1 Tax=Anopheles christyi TaxID=43041 RepID=A0A182KI66_9DIPT
MGIHRSVPIVSVSILVSCCVCEVCMCLCIVLHNNCDIAVMPLSWPSIAKCVFYEHLRLPNVHMAEGSGSRWSTCIPFLSLFLVVRVQWTLVQRVEGVLQ